MSGLSEAKGPITVLIADSSRMQAQLLLSALHRYPEFRTCVSRMETGALLHSAATKVPAVALICPDTLVSAAENMATLRHFHLAHPEVAKILLVESCDRQLTINAFRSGVRGIFCLNVPSLRQLRKCIQRVASGQIWANSEQLDHVFELLSEVPSLRVVNAKGAQLLSPREEQVVALVAEGLGNRDVAKELNISEHTVKKYLFRIFEKLGISSRVELVLYAVNNGKPRGAEWLAVSRAVLPT